MARTRYDKAFKLKIVNQFYKGESQISIAKKFGINKSIVSRLIKRYKSTGTVEDANKGGRKRKTSARTDRKIVRLFKNKPFITSKNVVKKLQLNISSSTVRKRALENSLRSYMPSKKPILTKKHRKRRLEFAKAHSNWPVEKWKTVLFSDESKFNLLNSDGVWHVRRPKGKRLDPRYSKGTIKHGGGNIMAWTCFSANGVGPFVEISTKMDRFLYRDILANHMLPYAEWEMPLRWVFQHDNDPKHSSKLVKEWLCASGVQVMDWPAQSPDLNPIENLFGILKRRIGTRLFSNKMELFTTLKQEWESIPKIVLTKLIESMPKRCAEVIKNKGYHTKY